MQMTARSRQTIAELPKVGGLRLPSIDATRGLIIALMAIDHARGFIAKNHPGEFWGRPLPDYGGDALAFLTRLVTHPCAPGFFFLMGAGMALLAAARAEANWSTNRIVRHFVRRGLVLILLGQVLEIPASSFAFANATRVEFYGVRVPGGGGSVPSLILGVLYALGAALVLASVLVRLRPAALVGVAAAGAFVAQWITPSPAQADVPFHPLLRLLFIPGQTGSLLVVYPAVAWLPCTILGMAFARWLLDDREAAFRRAALAGILFLGLFGVIRALGEIGNVLPPRPGWIGFFNLVKYPPSLTFLLFTLGVDLLVLAAFERWRVGEQAWARPLLVFGSVPLFFFFAHLWLYAAIGRFFPAGTTLPRMYVFWLIGLVLLYWLCRWYGEFKRRRPEGSIFRML
jgi:uncharacterized membrane protein